MITSHRPCGDELERLYAVHGGAIGIQPEGGRKNGGEIGLSLVTMMATQNLYHLADQLHVGMAQDAHGQWYAQWYLIAPVVCIAPIVIWRVHVLTHSPGGHGADAHGGAEVVVAERQTLTGDREGAHVDGGPRPPHGGGIRPDAHRVLLPEQAALGARSYERGISAGGGTGSAHPALPPAQGWTVPAHELGAMSAETLSLLRQAVVRPLYDELNRRPTVSDIYTALKQRGLIVTDETQSRSTCQRVRKAIEDAEPHLNPPRSIRSA